MKRMLLLTFTALLPLNSVRAATVYPCKPNELGRFHLPTLLDSTPSVGVAEPQIQQECIAWEAVIQPKGAFSGAFILRPEALSLVFSPRLGAEPSTPVAKAAAPASSSGAQGGLPPPSLAPKAFSFKPTDLPIKIKP